MSRQKRPAPTRIFQMRSDAFFDGNIASIRKRYGCRTDTEAVRLAVRVLAVVARNEEESKNLRLGLCDESGLLLKELLIV